MSFSAACEAPTLQTEPLSRTQRLSARQRGQSTRQHVNAAADPLGRSVFVGPMAHAAAAGDEEHGDGRDAAIKNES